MTRWFENMIADKINDAKNHVILLPAQNPIATIDVVDIYDGVTGQFVAADVPEEQAREFAIIWNGLVDIGENTEAAKKINFGWLVKDRKRHNY